jgi:hypothetical protein
VSKIPAHGHDGVAVRGGGGRLHSGAMAASLPGATRPTRLPSRQPPRLPRCLLRRCGYGVAPGRTLAAWGPFWPWVISNSTIKAFFSNVSVKLISQDL